MNRTVFINGRQPGVNVDRINVEAGMSELSACGYDDQSTAMVIGYALNLWRRGEEALAQRTAIDQAHHGVDLTSWSRVLARARAAAEIGRAMK